MTTTRGSALAAAGRMALAATIAAGMTVGGAYPVSAQTDDRAGGWTRTGTVVGKGYEPPGPERVVCTGAAHRPGACHKAPTPECWRLDLQNLWIFYGWRCVDAASWERIQIGDRYPA